MSFAAWKKPSYVILMAVISVIPLMVVYKLFNTPLIKGTILVHLMMCFIPFAVFAKCAEANKDLPEYINKVFAISFILSYFVTMPVYWLVGIFIPYVRGNPPLKSVDLSAKTRPGWTFCFSIAPISSVLLTRIWIHFFSLDSILAAWVCAAITVAAVTYFSYHALRYPVRILNREIYWALSFVMTGTLSIPVFWYQRIYKPALLSGSASRISRLVY